MSIHKIRLLALAVLFALAARPPEAGAWTSPVNLSSDADATAWGNAAVGCDGTVHVVWTDQTTREMKYSARPYGGAWTSPAVVATYAGTTLFSDGDIAVAVASDGTVHIVYCYDSSGHSEIHHRSLPPGGSWSAAVDISQTPGTRSEFPHVAGTPDGVAHAIWIDATPSGGICCSETYYASRSIVGVWTPAINISNNGANEYEISIGAGPDNSVHVITAQEDGGPGQQNIYYYEKPAGGAFLAGVNLNNNPNIGRNMGGVAKGADGTVHLVYYQGNPSEVMYWSRPACGTWSGPINLSNDAGSSGNPDVGVDACGTVHVVWVDDAAGGQIQYTGHPLGGSWTIPQVVTAAAGPGRVRLALGGARGIYSGSAEVVYMASPGDAYLVESEWSGCGAAGTVAVSDPTGPPEGMAANFIRVEPNPTMGRVLLRLPEGGASEAIAIFDAAGRQVRSLDLSARTGGWREAEWDGHDAAGRAVPAGVYWARATWSGREAASRVVLVR